MAECVLIPANCKAVEDFKAGYISEQEMWAILNRNIGIASTTAMIAQRYEVKPGKGDLVSKGDLHGFIIRRIGEDVLVKFYSTGETEILSIDDFEGNNSSKGGRTHWELEDI